MNPYIKSSPTRLFLILLIITAVDGLRIKLPPKYLLESFPIQVTGVILQTFEITNVSLIQISKLLAYREFDFQGLYDHIDELPIRILNMLNACDQSTGPFILSPGKIGESLLLSNLIFNHPGYLPTYPIAVGTFSGMLLPTTCVSLSKFLVKHQRYKIDSIWWLQVCFNILEGDRLTEFINESAKVLTSDVLAGLQLSNNKIELVLEALLFHDSSLENFIRIACWAFQSPSAGDYIGRSNRYSSIKGIFGDLNYEEVSDDQFIGNFQLIFASLPGDSFYNICFEVMLTAYHLGANDHVLYKIFHPYAHILPKVRITSYLAKKIHSVIPSNVKERLNLVEKIEASIYPESKPNGLLTLAERVDKWKKLYTRQVSLEESLFVSDELFSGHADLRIIKDNFDLETFRKLIVEARMPPFFDNGVPLNLNLNVHFLDGKMVNIADLCTRYIDGALKNDGWLFDFNGQVALTCSSKNRWKTFTDCLPYLLIRGHKIKLDRLFAKTDPNREVCHFPSSYSYYVSKTESLAITKAFSSSISTQCRQSGLDMFSIAEFTSLLRPDW